MRGGMKIDLFSREYTAIIYLVLFDKENGKL